MSITPTGIYRGAYLLKNLLAASPSWQSHTGLSGAAALASVHVSEIDVTVDRPPLMLVERMDDYSRRRTSTSTFNSDGSFAVSMEVLIDRTGDEYADSNMESRQDEEVYVMNLAGSVIKDIEELSVARAAIFSDNPFNLKEHRIVSGPFRVPLEEQYNLVSPEDGRYSDKPLWFVTWEMKAQ